MVRMCITKALLFLALFRTVSTAVQAQFFYATNNGGIEIVAYSGPGGAVEIPSMANGLPVTKIGFGAFQGEVELTSVTIPDSVMTIGDQAFSSCTKLTAATFGSNVISIGAAAFSYCSSLTQVVIPASVTNTRAQRLLDI
jgi:hypothetical protein